MSTNERRERLLALESEEGKTKSLFATCRAVGDWRNERQARRDLASLQRARRALRGRPAAVQAAA